MYTLVGQPGIRVTANTCIVYQAVYFRTACDQVTADTCINDWS